MRASGRATRRSGALRTALVVSTALLATGWGSAQPSLAASPAPSTRPSGGSGAWLPSTPVGWPQVVDYSRTPATELTRGVEQYAETYDTVGGRQHIQVLTADLADPNVRTGVVEAGDEITDPADETTSSMADRTGAVAGVNGGYFEINTTGRPIGGVISGGTMLKSPQPGFAAQLGVKPDGTMVMGPETFSGTVTDGAQSYQLASVNTVNDVAAGKITEITPYLGAAGSLSSGTLVLGQVGADGAMTVGSVQTGVTSTAQLPQGEVGLLGGGAGGQWLAGSVHVGDTLRIASQLSPDNDLTQLISGVTTLVKNGQVYSDPTGTPPSGVNPETAVGITKDGKHVIAVAIDGEESQDTAVGVTPAEAAGYLVAHGAYTGLLFDGGGSTTEVAREPGAKTVSIVNTPSDQPGDTERPVANGLFFYTTAQQAGPATTTVVNGGAPITTVTGGGSVSVPVYATDAVGNPASGNVRVEIEPPSLATWSNGTLTPLRSGTGVIIASDGHARTTERLTVVSELATLTISPNTPDVGNGATRQLSLTGTDTAGNPVQVPAESASWQVSPNSLGTVDAHGLLTAAASGGGMATVTASAGGVSATASVAVGSVSRILDPMSSTATWTLSTNTTGQPATLAADPGDVPPGSADSGSLQLAYTMPAGSGVKQLVLSPATTLRTATDNGQNPDGIGLWVKGNGSGIELAESYLGVNGTRTTLYPTTVTWNGWQLVVAQLPAGLQFPLTISFIDFLAISPSTASGGSLNVSDLQALYSPRPVTTQPYQAVPANPSWLKYEENPADFAKQGSTLLVGGDAGLLASAPDVPGAEVMHAVAGALPSLSPQAAPDAAQFLGDMSGDGTTADLEYAKSAMDALGLPEHDVVGAGETSKGTYPETGDFEQVFGDTHYAYTEGSAEVIVTDSAHGGLLASDAYQSPAESQYPWIVQQLSDATTKDVIVATQLPAYDPTGSGKNQFTDAWEARMYVRLLQKYQQSHPAVHVIMVAGDANGFSEQILDPQGDHVSAADNSLRHLDTADGSPGPVGAADGGIPQFTFADLGSASTAPADEGGFAQFGLIRIGDAGGIQFAVQPVLASITVTAPGATLTPDTSTTLTITAPAASLAPGASTTLTATGTEIGGGSMPIAAPAAHVWSSDDTAIASVDAVTGRVTAHRAGTVKISVTSGDVIGSAQLTVG